MIRDLVGADKPSIRAVVQAIIKNQGLHAGFYWTHELLEAELRTLKGVGHFGDDLKAFILYRELPGVLDITIVACHPEARRNGYVVELIRTLAKKHQDIWLEVHEENVAAQRLYEKAGFLLTGRRPRYYKDDGTALLYSLKAV